MSWTEVTTFQLLSQLFLVSSVSSVSFVCDSVEHSFSRKEETTILTRTIAPAPRLVTMVTSPCGQLIVGDCTTVPALSIQLESQMIEQLEITQLGFED